MFACADQCHGQMMTGPLLVATSSMTTMEEFRLLTSIGSSNNRTTVNGKGYTLVINGVMYGPLARCNNTCAGNNRLTDLGHVLDLQLDAAGGTYVANNERLCFEASTAWARRNDSFLEYLLSSVCVYGVCA